MLDALTALQDAARRERADQVAQATAEQPSSTPGSATRATPATNGKAAGSKAAAALEVQLPSVFGKANGAKGSTNGAAAGEEASVPLPPGLQARGQAEVGSEDAAPALFEVGRSIEVSATNAIDANFELIQDHTRLAEVVAALSGEKVVAVDTETIGLDPFADNALLLVQVATTERAYLVDATRVDPRPLRRILEDERTLKLLQNAKFDYKMLRQQLDIRMRNMYDTMLAERVLTAGISREIGLAALAKKYLNLTLDKSIRSSFIGSKGEFTQDQLRYAARDALALFSIYEQQRVELQRQKLLKTADLEFRTLVAVGEMELAGCLIDQEKWRTIIEGAKAERDRAAQELGDMLVAAGAVPQLTLFGGPAINLNSNAQLLETFRYMGIDLPDTMEATLLKENHPAIKKLLEYRGFEKTLSAFGEKFLELIHPKTGRIHPDFNQLGADTGRFSCTNPNVQQIPATSDFRSCFVAPEGYKLITCDYSQCIARDSWVSTKAGWARIQEHPRAISKGIAETVLVRTGRRYQLECTADHRILTDKGWVAASALTVGDWLALEGPQVGAPTSPDPYWWLVGFWVGDGSFNNSPGSVYFALNSEPDSTELGSFIQQTLREQPRVWGQSYAVTNQRQFADALHGLFDKRDLRLPLDRIDDCPSLLSGLFDADGNVDQFGVGLATKFEGLARDVQQALLRYGIMATITSCRGGYNFIAGGAPYFRVRLSDSVSLRNFARYIGFRFTRKANALKQLVERDRRDEGNYVPVPVDLIRMLGFNYRTHVLNHLHGRPYTRRKLQDEGDPALHTYLRYHWDRVTSVQPSGRHVEVFDLMDQPEQRFIAAGFVVHNCELRVLAQLSEDPAFIDAFSSGGDLHQLTASQMYQVPPDQVTKQMRSAAKVINFGLAYGRGPAALGGQLGVSTEEAKKLIEQYFKAYSSIGKWLDRAGKDAVRKGYSATMLGRKRFYPSLDPGDPEYNKKRASTERQGKNSPIQGTNADMTKLALIGLHEVLLDYDARVVNTVHDEIVVEAREDQAEVVCKIVEREMVKAGEQIIKLVPIVADAKIADYWSK